MAKRITLKWLQENWSKSETMVPARDGTKLYTAIYQRKGLDRRRPVMLIRTPFSLKPYGKGFSKRLRYKLSNYVLNDYIIVFQNVRGTYLSEGIFENVRCIGPAPSDAPANATADDNKDRDANAETGQTKPETSLKHLSAATPVPTGEATDTYDTAQWLLENTLCNGNIGVQGMSYPGFYATAAAVCGHPAVKAVSPQAPVTDWFMGDDLHHNGAFMLADACSFGNFFFKKRHKPSGRSLPCRPITEESLYDFYKGKSIKDILEPYLKRKDSFWQDIAAHPDYDAFWRERNAAASLKDIRPAMLLVGGLFDAEDNYGPLECWRRIKAESPETDVSMCLGPWPHGSWLEQGFDSIDDSYMGDGLTDYFLDEVEYPFFACHLEGIGEGPQTVTVLPSAAASLKKEKGTRDASMIAEHHTCWPPEGLRSERLYLAAKGRVKTLSGSLPAEGQSFGYVSDPGNPVPYYPSDCGWSDRSHMAADQRFLDSRKDVLTFEGAALKETVKACGTIKVHLEFSVSTDDADFVVKLIDTRPDGYRMLVRGDIMPARYRNGYAVPEPLKPGKRTVIEFTLNDIAHEFLPGHRLTVQIQSSCFPLFAMNPQKFVRNQYFATEYIPAAVTLHSGSYIELQRI